MTHGLANWIGVDRGTDLLYLLVIAFHVHHDVHVDSFREQELRYADWHVPSRCVSVLPGPAYRRPRPREDRCLTPQGHDPRTRLGARRRHVVMAFHGSGGRRPRRQPPPHAPEPPRPPRPRTCRLARQAAEVTPGTRDEAQAAPTGVSTPPSTAPARDHLPDDVLKVHRRDADDPSPSARSTPRWSSPSSPTSSAPSARVSRTPPSSSSSRVRGHGPRPSEGMICRSTAHGRGRRQGRPRRRRAGQVP